MKTGFFTWYLIVFYIGLIIFNFYFITDTLQQEEYDYWEKAECPQDIFHKDYRFVNVECEKHFELDRGDKTASIVIVFLISLLTPWLVAIAFAIVYYSFTGGEID